jgi:peroxiredoxin
MRRLFSRAALPLAALALAMACSGGPEQPAAPVQQTKAPDFSLATPLGGKISLQAKEASGPVLLLFWSVYCGACQYIVPDLNALQEKYKDKFSIIGVSIGDAPYEVSDYAATKKIKYPLVLDTEGKVSETYHVRGTPTAILVGRDGMVKHVWLGYSPSLYSDIETSLSTLLK